MAAQTVNAVRRIGRSVSRKNSRLAGADLYLLSLPDKTEWVSCYDLKMLMLDG